MKILAIESSALTASIAVIVDGELSCEYTTHYKKTHSQTLMPMIDEVVKTVELDLSALDYIAVSSGPGSFTGLRIGASTAKGLAHVLQIPIVPVPTLDGLAYNVSPTDSLICPLMDARRDQVYTALYEYKEQFVKLTDYLAVPIDVFLERIKNENKKVIFIGDGIKPHRNRIDKYLNPKLYSIGNNHSLHQRAASIAELGILYAKAGKAINSYDFAPLYLRKTQAEREYERKIKNL